nr:YvrJ family protein [Novibacillus thermophilus]
MQTLGNVGFPILIALFLLFRFEVRIEHMEKRIQELSEVIKELRRDYRE